MLAAPRQPAAAKDRETPTPEASAGGSAAIADAARSNRREDARNTWQALRRSERTAPQSRRGVASVPSSHPRNPSGRPGCERSLGGPRSPRSQPSPAQACVEQGLEGHPREPAPQTGPCQPALSVPAPPRRSWRDSSAHVTLPSGPTIGIPKVRVDICTSTAVRLGSRSPRIEPGRRVPVLWSGPGGSVDQISEHDARLSRLHTPSPLRSGSGAQSRRTRRSEGLSQQSVRKCVTDSRPSTTALHCS